MASDFDASEFVDEDFRNAPASTSAAAAASSAPERAPSREEVESKVHSMQAKLTELRQAQQDLEKERSSLEDLRRRQSEFAQGREEMLHHLTRGVGILEEAELSARREVDQMARTLEAFRDSLDKISAINEEEWSKEDMEVSLTRASTTIENARMEWNAALVKLPLLSEDKEDHPSAASDGGQGEGLFQSLAKQQSYTEMCKMGLALTWPLALAATAIFLVLLIRS